MLGKVRGAAVRLGCAALLAVLGLLSTARSQPAAQARNWPTVAPARMSVFFADGEHASLAVEVLSIGGRELYHLECKTFALESRSFNYSGDFECRLIDPGQLAEEHRATLLADAESAREWDTRGRFLRDEVHGDCGHYPEYGRTRSFRLRGLELRLSLADIVFQPQEDASGTSHQPRPAFRSFRFDISIRPEPSASSPIAELPAVLNPLRQEAGSGKWNRECRTVLKRQ